MRGSKVIPQCGGAEDLGACRANSREQFLSFTIVKDMLAPRLNTPTSRADGQVCEVFEIALRAEKVRANSGRCLSRQPFFCRRVLNCAELYRERWRSLDCDWDKGTFGMRQERGER